MYSYNIDKMSIIYLGDNKKKIQEVFLRPLLTVYYDKNTSDRFKILNKNHYKKISHNINNESQTK